MTTFQKTTDLKISEPKPSPQGPPSKESASPQPVHGLKAMGKPDLTSASAYNTRNTFTNPVNVTMNFESQS